MKKHKLLKSLKILSNIKAKKYIINKASTNKEICENYYRVDDKNGDERGEY